MTSASTMPPTVIGGLTIDCDDAAAMVAFYASTAGTILSRDVYRRYLDPQAGDRELKLYGRVGVGLGLLAALLTASYLPATDSELGALALSFGFQLWPALAAVCWFPWLTRQGVMVGLMFGLAAVVFTVDAETVTGRAAVPRAAAPRPPSRRPCAGPMWVHAPGSARSR